MSKKNYFLHLALCALLSMPLASYAAGDKSTDKDTRESVGETVSDAAITTKVKAAILADRMLKVMQIKVDTDQGVVRLSGTVDTSKAAARAVKVAKKVKGVKSVTNELEVKGKMDKGSSEMNKDSSGMGQDSKKDSGGY